MGIEDTRDGAVAAFTLANGMVNPITPAMHRELNAAILWLERTKPLIGAVRGWCRGRGLFSLLRLTDIRVATLDARVGLPEIACGMGGIGEPDAQGSFLYKR